MYGWVGWRLDGTGWDGTEEYFDNMAVGGRCWHRFDTHPRRVKIAKESCHAKVKMNEIKDHEKFPSLFKIIFKTLRIDEYMEQNK